MSCAIPTSKLAYESTRAQLSPMHRTVFDGVLRYRQLNDRWPTASEVHSYLVEEGSVEATSCTKARAAEMKKHPGKAGDIDDPVLTEYRQLEDASRSNPWVIRPTTEAVQ